jgi:flagellar motility protein MotE (MotC chaperone)
MKKIDKLKKSSVADLTKELVLKEKKMDEESAEIRRRQEQLKMSEESLAVRILEFEKEQKKVLNCMADAKAQSGQRINQIVSIIAGMKPAKAAQMLAIQDSEISVNILGKIDPERASKIFNLMDKEVSARLQKQYLDMRK